jgi:multidrug efflux pump subunit AcrA (membrane-fusion protein)
MGFSTGKVSTWGWAAVTLTAVAATLAATSQLWRPPLANGRSSDGVSFNHGADSHDDHQHAHGHSGHDEATSIELSPSGLKNIGFQPLAIELGSFTRMLTLPAIVVERPGRSQVRITSPLTGVITKIVPVQGAAVEPGSSMFEIRLTHEELVTAQSDLIRTSQSLDVVVREIERLQSLGEGVVAGKRILEQEYEKQKLEAALRADRQALILHGLTEEQVDTILHEQQLFKSLTVYAPAHTDECKLCRDDHLFHVQQLPVTLGQQVDQGQMLCVLADHCELYIEGRAFADDADRLRDAARAQWDISAALISANRATEEVTGLKLMYLADQVDPDSRAFHFYVSLPNQVALDQVGTDGSRFIDWRFKPGQRMELHVPVEKWENRIVVPVDAVVDEGPESYVYQQNGNHFDRKPVTVEHRDQSSVVIANNGSIFPGDVIAVRGAYQMHLALKNKSGGAIDPHAGHNH